MALPISVMIVGVVWLATAITSYRLRTLFLLRAGDSAPAVLRSSGGHPEKVFYFFRASTIPLLQAQSDLWRLRQLHVKLLVASAVAPIIGFGVVVFIALVFYE